MATSSTGRVQLVDTIDSERTTDSLVASLASRLAVLPLLSGSSAVGSLVAGIATLGRRVSRTAEGAQLRRALEAGRASTNGDALWRALRIGEWVAGLPPSPVLDHVRNDLALLNAEDLEEALGRLPRALLELGGGEPDEEPGLPTSVDFVIGIWAYSREIVRAVEALAAPTISAQAAVLLRSMPAVAAGGVLLR